MLLPVGHRSAVCRSPCLLSSLPQTVCLEQAQWLEFESSTPLWLEGSQAISGYFICSGVIQLSQRTLDGKSLVLDLLGPGEMVGLSALLANERHMSEAQVLRRSTLVRMGRGELLELTKSHRELVGQIAKLRVEKRERLRHRLLLACYGGVRERLIWELLDLGKQFGRWQKGEGLVIELGLHKHDLERLVGVRHTSLIETTEDLERRSLCIFGRQAITLADTVGLAKLLGNPGEIRYLPYQLAVRLGQFQLSQRTLDGKSLVLDLLGPGEMVGLSALLANERHMSEAQVLRRSTLVRMGRGELLELTKSHRELVGQIAKLRVEKRERLRHRLLLACYGGVRERLIWELLDLGKQFGRWQKGEGLVIELGLHKHDLERLVGVRHTSLIETTEDLERRSLCIFGRQAITLADTVGLAKLLGNPGEIRYWEEHSNP